MASAASNLAASIARKTKTKKKHFVSQKVKLFRASDPLLSVLMWGVNHSYCGMFCPGPRESVKRLCQQAKRVLAQMRGSGTQS